MKTVWILGAGASESAGGPLMNTFLDKAQYLADHGGLSQREVLSIRAVFKALHSLDPVFAKASINARNVEALFSAVSMGQLLGRFGSAEESEIAVLQEHLTTLVAATVEASMPMRKPSDQLPWLHPGYTELWKWAVDLRDKPGDKPTFITFNYDIALDQALVGASTCLQEQWNPSNINLLKLHGSLAWRSCAKCGLTFDTFKHEEGHPLESNRRITKHRLSSPDCPACGIHTDPCATPFIVPPTWNKLEYHEQLANVWRAASDALRSAQQIIVSGYSLPPSDEFFRYLYALGVHGDARVTRFAVYDPFASQGVSDRFLALLGEGIRDRFESYDKPFDFAVLEERKRWKSAQAHN